MLTIPKLQELASILKRCYGETPFLIAGGAPRDVICGKEVKDIDVFIEYEGSVLKGEKDLISLLYTEDVSYEGGSYECASFRVVNLQEGFHMYPIQLIYLNDATPREKIESFDFGLCQAWVSASSYGATPTFRRDLVNHTLTHLGKTNGNEWTSKERVEKLQEKYKGWKFIGIEGIMRDTAREILPAEPVDYVTTIDWPHAKGWGKAPLVRTVTTNPLRSLY